METATVSEIKRTLKEKEAPELMELCLRLARFKKDNKELLTYLLFEADDEQAYIRGVQNMMDEKFDEITSTTYYLIKKSIRKILALTKKNIRYSGKKETEVQLLIYFCTKLDEFEPSIDHNVTLTNMYQRTLDLIKRKIAFLEEDLQYDYTRELEELM